MGCELNSKDEAMKKAMIFVAERENKDQKCCIFGEKIGNWLNEEGPVISLTKDQEEYGVWYNLRLFKSVESLENMDTSCNGVYLRHGTRADDYVLSIGKTFFEYLLRNFSNRDTYVNIAFKLYKKQFEILYDNWEGEENDNNHRSVIAMIGSTRFQETFLDKCWEFSAKGYVVTLPNFRPSNKMAKGFDIPEDILEDIGYKRIDMADKIYVVNEDGYIGESTRKEIRYAEGTGKNIRYMEDLI